MKKLIVLVVFLSLFALTAEAFTAEESSTVPEVPVKGMVTMVDLGAGKCIPCKMMAPIIKNLQDEYSGKAAIVFIDVWKHPEQSRKFNAYTIPTQIFYDKNGNEIYRHEGFFGKDSILAILKKAGVDVVETPDPPKSGQN